ncbi:MAG: citrate (Si)-synthase, eukaryotic [Bacteroidetes bacterium RIFCSPLOWO2_12_FULL_37_12]|nr:MAG: citrate (Si)-synthase, eukaryotic [Bacteroidetes bacterium RIFCSPLOWO2_12_FULL_37_12]
MEKLKEKFIENALPAAQQIRELIKKYGNKVVGQYTLDQVFDGMRGMVSLITETSKLDPELGIRFRGYSIPELRKKLPKIPGGTEPMPEGIFYLMLIGELPTYEDASNITANWARRSNVPKFVFDIIDHFPVNTHPMTQFSVAIMAMQTQSVFAEEYREGKLNKKNYWEATYEDSMNLIARLPRIAAYIYRHTYKNAIHIEPKPELDWAGNFAHMLGYGESIEFKKLMRLYLTIHADHEGGNVSAHTTHLVGSALSDPYLAFSAGMNGLAGPLHGLANQEVVRWIMDLKKEVGRKPTKKEITNYIKKTLEGGHVIPGFGHAVLRVTDPRYMAQREFALTYLKNDENFKIVSLLYEVVPPILMELGKVKNPWPNVDAHSGVLLVHYGMEEYDFYTVLFGVSRALGVLASLIWDRALGLPLERPNSVTSEWVKRFVEQGG